MDGLMKENYDRLMMEETGRILEKAGEGCKPRILLHSCCGPCSTSVIERLTEYYDITVFFYNPNIDDAEEYELRKANQIKYIEDRYGKDGRVVFVEGPYDVESFRAFGEAMAGEPEGGKRCTLCFGLRLEEAARAAAEGGFDCFATTLTVSPMKNPEVINALGLAAGEGQGVKYLVSDFKKRAGYQRSIELSKEYNLYRQHYCGCSYGKAFQPQHLEK